MTPIVQAATTALIHFVWQGFALALLLWSALYLLKKQSAELRYGLSCATLFVLMLLPAITTYICLQRIGQQPTAVPAPQALRTDWNVIPIPHSVGSKWLLMLYSWALPLWAAGVIFFSLRLLWGNRQLAVLRRSGQQAGESVMKIVHNLAERMRLSRPVQVLISAAVEGPGVIGWLRPVILVPASSLLGLEADQLEAVLAHELAHLRRYDDLVNMLQMFAETLLFYHPAVWWTSKHIRYERELCCDDIAVRTIGDRLRYARALTRLERLRVSTPAMALGASDGHLHYRIRRIVSTPETECRLSKAPGILALCLSLGLVVIPSLARATSVRGVIVVGATGAEKPLTVKVIAQEGKVSWGIEKTQEGFRLVQNASQSDVQHMQERVLLLQRQLDESRRAAQDKDGTVARERIARLEFQVADAKRGLEHAQGSYARLVTMPGRILKSIEMQELPDETRAALLAHLGLQPGEILTQQSIDGMRSAVRAFNDRFITVLEPVGDKEAALRILVRR